LNISGLSENRLIAKTGVCTAYSLGAAFVFFHPDYTVGSGFAPDLQINRN